VDNLGKVIDNQSESITAPDRGLIAAAIDSSLMGQYATSRTRYRLDTLAQQFSPISSDIARGIFPLIDPLDLDLIISWRIPDTDRSGHVCVHGIRLGPEFSKVDDLRRKIEMAILKGGKQTRTMYEETGRLRKLLLDSVLDGVLAKEDDPVVVRGYVNKANAGVAELDLSQG
jgi:hypothetical protein